MKEVLDFASSLQRAAKAVQLYGHANHPRAREAAESLIDHTEAMLRQDRVQIVASRGSLFVQGQLIGLHSPAIDWLIAELNDRQLNGFVINKGVTAAELSQIVKVFSLKPPQLESAGGVEALLAEVEATHVRLSRTHYEEVRDGEIVMNALDRGSRGGAGSGSYDPTASLEVLARGGTLDDAESELFASFVGDWLRGRRIERRTDWADSTHPGPATAKPTAANTEGFPQLSASLAELIRNESSETDSLLRRLKELGISREELDEILAVVAWENLGVDERVARLLEGSMMFELPTEKVTAFILELCRTGRAEEAARLIDKLSAGLFSPSREHRKIAADAMQRVVGWIIDPGLPRVIEATVEKQLLTHFVKETEPQIQRRSQIAFMRLFDTWITRNQLPKALQTLRRLEGVAAATAAATPWKKELFEELLDRLVNEERMVQLLDLMHTQDPETVARDVHPIFVYFGGRAAIRLLEALEAEQDRSKRGRLIRAIKAIGKPALQHLEAALKSPTWYLVRNALNVLGDVTAMELIEKMAGCLGHEDERVRRAAARALGKMGGVRVERFLVEALKTNSAETQIEILGALGALKAESAIDSLTELGRQRRLGRADDPVRLKAIETLGVIGSPGSVAPLAEMIRRKSVLGGQEPVAVRKAICLALIAIGSLEAYKEVQAVADTDTDPDLRAELSKALWH